MSATRSPRPPSPHWRRLPHEWHRASYFERRCRDHEAELIVAGHRFLPVECILLTDTHALVRRYHGTVTHVTAHLSAHLTRYVRISYPPCHISDSSYFLGPPGVRPWFITPDWREVPTGISERHHGALASNVAFGDPPACLLTHPDDDALQATPGGPAHPSCGHSYHI